MNHINFNGKLFDEKTPVISAGNRGLRYGDGLFETLKYRNNELVLADEHFSRLWKGMQMLKFEIPKLFTPERLQEQIIELAAKNNLANARVRLSVIRGEGGINDVASHLPNHIIECIPLAGNTAALNENGLQLCIYRDAKKMAESFSNLKHNNFLPYFMGALHAREIRCNDAVILNNHDRVCDSTIANIFMVKERKLYTVSLDEGCVAGIMRKYIIQQLQGTGFAVTETRISIDELLNADEVFLSNSICNIRWVASINNKNYMNTCTREIFQMLSKTNPAVFC